VTTDEGTTVSGLLVTSGETLTISGDDAASADTILAGGSEIVLSGGFDSGTLLSGGLLSVTDGAVYGIVVRSGGQLVVGDPSTASGTVVSGGGTETVSGNGTDFSGTVESGGTVVAVSGGVLSGATILSGGVALISSGGAAVALTVQSGGSESIGAGGTLSGVTISGGTVDVLVGAASTETIGFAGSGGTLVLSGALTSGTAISGFVSGTGDNILLAGLTYSAGARASFAGGVITVTDGTASVTFDDPSGLASTPFSIVDVGGAPDMMPCFAAGTRLLTPRGEVAVEALSVGDLLVTVREGGAPTARIIWTGRRTLDLRRHAQPARVRPVRIMAGALGNGVPERDVRVSPNHAIYLDGALFEAIALVNGLTIIQESNAGFVTYHHVELAQHDIVLAEGMATESFLDTGSKPMFEAPGQPMALHPVWHTPAGATTCAPLHREGAKLAEVQARLLCLAQEYADVARLSRLAG
jgi:autotransporter passenger strand-loop-strand repeat protein